MQGGNTCIIIEAPTLQQESGDSGNADSRAHHVVTVSAKTQSSFDANKQRLLDYLTSNADVRLQDVAYTSTARRMHHPLRTAFSVSSIGELVRNLSQEITPAPTAKQTNIIFLFPGQGLRLAGFGKTLYNTSPPFRQTMSELDALCQAMELPSFLPVLLDQAADGAAAGPVVTQLAIVALEIALAQLLREWGIVPNAVVGHSLGEYAALCTAGVLSVSDTLFLVGKRAELVEKLCTPDTHGMLALGASADQCQELLDGQASLDTVAAACFNGPRSTVISGSIAELETVKASITDKHPGMRCSTLNTPYAFHSSQLDPVLEPYLELASCANFSKPEVPVASTLLGKLVGQAGSQDSPFSASYLVDHARKPVQFAAALRACETAGLTNENSLLIEVGPESMCLAMARATLQKMGAQLPCIKSADDPWNTLTQIVAKAHSRGLVVNWTEFNRPYELNLKLLNLPSYHFDLKNFWMQYEGGVAALQKRIQELELQLASKSAAPAAIAALPEAVISSCLHRIEEQTVSKSGGKITFGSDIQRQPLRDLLAGHNVIGVPIAPSSIVAEMAFAAAGHLYSVLYPSKASPVMELRDCVISAPLVLSQSLNTQMVNVSITWEKADTLATVSISSDRKHAHCKVAFVDGGDQWTREWSRKHYLINERVQSLVTPDRSASAEPVHHLWRDMVYKIFAPITSYSAAYWSMASVFIRYAVGEAAVQLDLRETPSDSTFTYDPSWLDGIAQAAGFMLNSNPSKHEDFMYVATGWEALRVGPTLTPGRYNCHVRTHTSKDGNTVLCDVTVLNDTTVVAVGDGLIFKRIKQALLLTLFGQAAGSGTKAGGRASSTPPQKPTIITQATPKALSAALLKPKQKKTAAKSPPRARPQQSTAVLSLIAEEAGVSVAELADDSTLESLGVDSLLAVSITSRLKTEMDIDLPAALMIGSTTISELRSQFGGVEASESSSQSEEDDDDDDESDGGTATPPSPSTPLTPASPPDLVDEFVAAVAGETGIEPQQIDDDTPFTDLGVDSLMSISIIGTLKERTGIELPATLLTDCTTMAEAKNTLRSKYGASPVSSGPVAAAVK